MHFPVRGRAKVPSGNSQERGRNAKGGEEIKDYQRPKFEISSLHRDPGADIVRERKLEDREGGRNFSNSFHPLQFEKK